VKFSKKEIIDLVKSWIFVSLAFTIFQGLKLEFSTLIFSTITIGLGFILHELAHKFVAQKYGCAAEFRSNDSMLLFGVVLSFFSLLFLAPGAVFILGRVSLQQSGKISAAGPATNIILALLFLVFVTLGVFPQIAFLGMIINSWLAVFNLLPFPSFDGQKILAWNKVVYIGMVIVSGLIMVLQTFLGGQLS